jgi:hypothetical protein
MIYERALGVYAEPRLEDRFAPALGAPTGPGQAAAPTKDEPAVLAACRLHAEPALSTPGYRFDDVREMFFNLPFGNAQAMREVSGRVAGAGQHLHDLLPDGQL